MFIAIAALLTASSRELILVFIMNCGSLNNNVKPQRNQTVYYTTDYDSKERVGVIQEVTSMGYKIDNTWYNHGTINFNNVLLDSRQQPADELILG